HGVKRGHALPNPFDQAPLVALCRALGFSGDGWRAAEESSGPPCVEHLRLHLLDAKGWDALAPGRDLVSLAQRVGLRGLAANDVASAQDSLGTPASEDLDRQARWTLVHGNRRGGERAGDVSDPPRDLRAEVSGRLEEVGREL